MLKSKPKIRRTSIGFGGGTPGDFFGVPGDARELLSLLLRRGEEEEEEEEKEAEEEEKEEEEKQQQQQCCPT